MTFAIVNVLPEPRHAEQALEPFPATEPVAEFLMASADPLRGVGAFKLELGARRFHELQQLGRRSPKGAPSSTTSDKVRTDCLAGAMP